MTARFSFASSLGLIALLALAGCGGSGSGGTTNAGSGSTVSGGQASAASVDVASNPKLGPILVDGQGRTLYLFQKDTGGQSSCSGSCASIWPPDTTASPKAGTGVSASKLGTVKRSDGTMQVTYAGHPLYTYTADTGPGPGKRQRDQHLRGRMERRSAEWLERSGRHVCGREHLVRREHHHGRRLRLLDRRNNSSGSGARGW